MGRDHTPMLDDFIERGQTNRCANRRGRYTWRMPALDLVGLRFGCLTVVSKALTRARNSMWQCRCSCGRTKIVGGQNLRRGTTKSCGCLNIEIATNRVITHGKSHTPIYSVWQNMLARCYSPTHKSHANYGGRGIGVCDRWRYSFVNFYTDVGDPPKGHTLDRINNNADYEPNNCRWATPKEQSRNSRKVRLITYAGETMNLTEWAARIGVSHATIIRRIKKGWPLEIVLTGS